ncbi:MAG: hypothetical protein ACJAYU_004625 [Bradymonadia bacterium]|jgi:hypothetical protein
MALERVPGPVRVMLTLAQTLAQTQGSMPPTSEQIAQRRFQTTLAGTPLRTSVQTLDQMQD